MLISFRLVNTFFAIYFKEMIKETDISTGNIPAIVPTTEKNKS